MSALTEPIAGGVRRWATEQATPGIARLDLRRLPVPEATRPAFCEDLKGALGLTPTDLDVQGHRVRLWVNGELSLAAVVALTRNQVEMDALDSWMSTQDFAIRLRDRHSEDSPENPLSRLNLLLVLDADMESLTSTSVDLARLEAMRPSRLVRESLPAADPTIKALLGLDAVGSALDQALRTPDGNKRIGERLEVWRTQGLPPPEAFLSELLGWFPDPDLCGLVEEASREAEDRAAENKAWADTASRLRERGADLHEWADAFDGLPQAKLASLVRDGPGATTLGEVLTKKPTPRFEGFRYRKPSSLCISQKSKKELHLLSTSGKGIDLGAEYSQAAQTAFRLTIDGALVPEARLAEFIEAHGKDLRIKVPENKSERCTHYVWEIYYGRSTTRGRPSQTVRAIVAPPAVPELILETFQVGDVHRPALVISVAPPTLIQSPSRRVTKSRAATPALDSTPVWPLPCRIENGPSEPTTWRFETDGGIFELPISCEDTLDTEEPPPYFGALLDPTIQAPRPAYWMLEAEGRGVQEESRQARKALSVGAQDDLRKERLWVEGGWLSATEDSRHEWLESQTPGAISSNAEFVKLRGEYKLLYAWLQGRGTLPSLVEAWATEYWERVDSLLKSVRAFLQSSAPGQHQRAVWAAGLGCVKDATGAVTRTSPLWPPALACAAAVAKRLREAKLEYPHNLLQALSPASAVPINLAAPGVGRLSLARRRSIWTWADWTPVDQQADAPHPGLGRIFRNTLDRFIDSFHQLCGPEVPAPIRIRFLHVLPDSTLVDALQRFIEDGIGRGTWAPEKSLELEFLLDEPDRPTPLDSRLDPGREDVTAQSGADLFRTCVRVAKLHTSVLQAPPPGWDPYVHITFIGSVTQYSPGTADAETVEACAIDGGTLPSRPVDLVMPNSGRPLSFGAGTAGRGTLADLESFALLWNRLIATTAFGSSAAGPNPVPTVTPEAMQGQFPIDLGGNSKWLVYLDPGVGLIPLSSPEFMGGHGKRPILVHFTTSAARGMPGYSDVTLTEHVEDMEASLSSVCSRFKARPASQLLPILNSVNGSWLLKLVKAETRAADTEDLLSMAIAAHDIVPRLRSQHPDYVWVVSGWEDFHWVTGASGNEQESAVFVTPEGGSDDLLAVGIRRTGTLSVVPVVAEVKYGSSPIAPGLKQVKTTVDKFNLQLGADTHAGALLRSQFGQYILRSAERMAAHAILPAEDAMFLQRSQAALRQGQYPVDERHPESSGYVVHVDPSANHSTHETQLGIRVLRIPFGVPVVQAIMPAPVDVAPIVVSPARPVAAIVSPGPAPIATKPFPVPKVPAKAGPTRPPSEPAPAPAGATASWCDRVLSAVPQAPLPGSADPDSRLLTIDRLLREFRVEVDPPEKDDIVPGPQAVAVHLRPGPGVSVSKIRSALESLQVALGSTQALSITTSQRPGYVTLFVPQSRRSIIPLQAVVHSVPQGPGSGVPFPAGVSVANEVIWLDLRDTNHLLLAGATGSGKTVYLKGVLLSLMIRFSPDDLRVHLIDPKGLDFNDVADGPHFVSEPAATTADAVRILEGLEKEIGRRRGLLAGAKAANIFQYRDKKRDEPLPFEVVVIDEYNQLRLTGDAKDSKRLESLVCQLAQIGRAYGIYLIVATQRPSVEVITGDIKANFPTRLSFKVATGTDSRVILDQEGAETLLPRGDGMILEPSGRLLRFQAPAVDDSAVSQVMEGVKAAKRRRQ